MGYLERQLCAGLWENLPQDNKFVVFPAFWGTDAALHSAYVQPSASPQWVSSLSLQMLLQMPTHVLIQHASRIKISCSI